MFKASSTAFFNCGVQVALGVVGPALERTGLFVQRLGGGHARFLVVFENRDRDIALVHLAVDAVGFILGGDDILRESR